MESRLLLSAPYEFAAVGFRFDAVAPEVFEMLGTLADDGSVTGTQTFAERTGAPASGPIDVTSIQLLSKGRLSVTPTVPYLSQVGGNFIPERGYPFGSFFGEFTGGADVSFLIQRAAGLDISWDVFDRQQFQYLELSADGFAIHAGQIRGGASSVSWSDSPDGSNPFDVAILSQDEFGSIHLANGMVLHTSPSLFPIGGVGTVYPPGDVVLMVDTDNSDGKIGFGIARRNDDGVQFGSAGMQGLYRTSILTDGPLSTAFFHAEALTGGMASARVALDLQVNGRYVIYDLADYDVGDLTLISTGTWTGTGDAVAGRGNLVVLTADSDDARAYFTITQNFALVPYFVSSEDGTVVEQMIGGATAFTPSAIDRGVLGGHVALDDDGRPIFYETVFIDNVATPDVQQWYSQDLIELWGGKPLVAVDSIEMYQQGFQVVGVATDGDVLAWERTSTGRWIFINLTDELNTTGIVSDITIFNHSGTDEPFIAGQYAALAVAGKNADGEIVLYTPLIEFDSYGAHPWRATAVSVDELTPFDEDTPAWTGGVQGYQTSWGGLNIVGLNAAGELIVVWTALGLDHWFTSNLSEISGTPELAGSISIIMTEWNAIHIHALDAEGHLHSTWWVPQFAGAWAHDDLTGEFDGPDFDPAPPPPPSAPRRSPPSSALTTH